MAERARASTAVGEGAGMPPAAVAQTTAGARGSLWEHLSLHAVFKELESKPRAPTDVALALPVALSQLPPTPEVVFASASENSRAGLEPGGDREGCWRCRGSCRWSPRKQVGTLRGRTSRFPPSSLPPSRLFVPNGKRSVWLAAAQVSEAMAICTIKAVEIKGCFLPAPHPSLQPPGVVWVYSDCQFPALSR